MSKIARLFEIPDYLPYTGLTREESRKVPLWNLHNQTLLSKGGGEIPANVTAYLEPHVQYKHSQVAAQTPIEGQPTSKDVHFIGLEKVPMGDWDWDSPSHTTKDAVSIESLGDVYDRLDKYTTDTNSKWRVYLTPGGVRAWNMTENPTPYEMYQDYVRYAGRDIGEVLDDPQSIIKNKPALDLRTDPYYAKITSRRDRSKLYPEGFTPPAYWSRVSGKPASVDRPKDFVAYYLNDVGQGKVNPYNDRVVTQYHDQMIRKVLAEEGLNPHQAALELLNKHLPTVPRKWAIPVEQRLERQGLI